MNFLFHNSAFSKIIMALQIVVKKLKNQATHFFTGYLTKITLNVLTFFYSVLKSICGITSLWRFIEASGAAHTHI